MACTLNALILYFNAAKNAGPQQGLELVPAYKSSHCFLHQECVYISAQLNIVLSSISDLLFGSSILLHFRPVTYSLKTGRQSMGQTLHSLLHRFLHFIYIFNVINRYLYICICIYNICIYVYVICLYMTILLIL